MSTAREEILERVRRALAPAHAQALTPAAGDPAPAPNGPPTRTAPVPLRPDAAQALVERFVERVEDYRATVGVVEREAVGATIGAICERHGVRRLAVPSGVAPGWVPAGVEIYPVEAVDAAAVRQLDAVDGVLTTSFRGVAETGTIVLDGGLGQGPRAATLLPDLHVCVVEAAAIVPGVAELTVAMGRAVREHGRPLTMISGPSATSDIELDRVEGVHGPRRLEVVVVAG